MTGASIVGWCEQGAVVLAVHGAFDGASAWALRIRMEEGESAAYVIDLSYAEEACEFAACLLSAWSRQHAGVALRFRTSSPAQARLLAAYGLEVEDEDGPGAALPASGPAPSFGVTV